MASGVGGIRYGASYSSYGSAAAPSKMDGALSERLVEELNAANEQELLAIQAIVNERLPVVGGNMSKLVKGFREAFSKDELNREDFHSLEQQLHSLNSSNKGVVLKNIEQDLVGFLKTKGICLYKPGSSVYIVDMLELLDRMFGGQEVYYQIIEEIATDSGKDDKWLELAVHLMANEKRGERMSQIRTKWACLLLDSDRQEKRDKLTEKLGQEIGDILLLSDSPENVKYMDTEEFKKGREAFREFLKAMRVGWDIYGAIGCMYKKLPTDALDIFTPSLAPTRSHRTAIYGHLTECEASEELLKRFRGNL